MFERISWIVLALVNLPPFVTFFAPSLISRLYGFEPGTGAFPLLHHRAALFGCVVIACVWAAVDGSVNRLAVVITALSMLSFIAVYVMNGSPPSLRPIAAGDLIGLPFLAYVAWRAFLAG